MLKALTSLGPALALAAALAVHPTAAVAQTPAGNDSIEGATPIAVPGGVEDQDTSGATASEGDPRTCWKGYTVWFTSTAPATGTLRVDAVASVIVPPEDGSGFPLQRDQSTGLTVFAGEPDALVERGCFAPTSRGGGQVDAPVEAGERISIMAGALEPSTNTRMTISVRTVRAPLVDVAVDRTGTVDSHGTATVTGTLRCDVEAEATIFLAVHQPSQAEPSSDSTSAACTTTRSRWSFSVRAADGAAPFHPGRARLEGVVTASADGPATQVAVSTSVVLRPARVRCVGRGVVGGVRLAHPAE